MTTSSQVVRIEEVESAFLCELVDGLTATRTEHAVRATIAAWKDRVYLAGLDPDALLDTFERVPRGVDPAHEASQRWANASKREFVLACVAVYARGRQS
ncbi:MAG TPA: hypothetical protein VGM50_12885 [Gemmatimonadaceae bacterium]|jgi:hypothetical protein